MMNKQSTRLKGERPPKLNLATFPFLEKKREMLYVTRVFFPFSAHEFCVCPINNRRLLALSFLLSLTCRARSGSTVSICESPFRHRLRPPAALLVGDADSFPVAMSPLRPSLCLSVVLPSPPPWRRPPRSPLTPAPPAPPRHLIPLRHCHHLPPRPLPQRLATGLPPRGRGTRDLRGPRVHQRRHPHHGQGRRGARVREGVLPLGCRRRAGEELGVSGPLYPLRALSGCCWIADCVVGLAVVGSGLVAVFPDFGRHFVERIKYSWCSP